MRAALDGGGRLHGFGLERVMLEEAGLAAAATFALLFDLMAAVALWHGTGRKFIFALSPFFHGANTLIFRTIGSFPFVAFASSLLFLDCHALDGAGAHTKARAAGCFVRPRGAARIGLVGTAVTFAILQLVLPLRPYILSDDVAWTRLGNEFSWRLMADTTDGWM